MEVESILDSIKVLLGIGTQDINFDKELIILINGALAIVNKFGVGPEGYKILGPENTWDEFLLDRTDLEMVKANIYLRVRMMFDPPQNSFLVNAIKDQINESNWYIEIYRNPTVN